MAFQFQDFTALKEKIKPIEFFTKETPIFKKAEKAREEIKEKITTPIIKALPFGIGKALLRTPEEKLIVEEKFKDYSFSDLGKDLVNLGLNFTINPIARVVDTAREAATGKREEIIPAFGFSEAKVFEQEIIGSYPAIFQALRKSGDSNVVAGLKLGLMIGFDGLLTTGTIKTGLVSTRLAVKQLPESLLTKIQTEKVPVNDIVDVLALRRSAPRAEEFIKNLSNEERIALFRLSRAYQEAGRFDMEFAKRVPTALGEFAGKIPPITPAPVEIRPKRQLPGFVSEEAVPAFGLSLRRVKRVGGEIISKPAIPKELESLAQEARKFKSAEEFFGNITRGFVKNTMRGEIKLSKIVDLPDTKKVLVRPRDIESIKRMGEQHLIVLNRGKNGQLGIVDGGHRLAAARAAGQKRITTIILDESKPQLTDFYNQAVKEIIPTSEEIAKAITSKRFTLRGLAAKAEVAERRGQKIGYSEARATIREEFKTKAVSVSERKRKIIDYAKQFLAKEDAEKAFGIIARSKTDNDLLKAYSRIDNWAESRAKRTASKNIITLQKRILKAPGVAEDYKLKLNTLLDEYNLNPQLKVSTRKLEKFIKEELALGKDVEVPQMFFEAMELLRKRDELPSSAFLGMVEKMKTLEQLGRQVWKDRKAKYEAEKEFRKSRLLAGTFPMTTRPMGKKFIGEALTTEQVFADKLKQTLNFFNKLDKRLLPTDVLYDMLDGGRGTYDGVNSIIFKGTMDKDFNFFWTLKDDIQLPIVKLASELKLNDQNFERIGVVAADEQANGRQRLYNLNLTDKEIEAVKLTPAERQWLEEAKKEMDKQFPFVVDIMLNLYNKPVKKTEDYFTWTTDWEKTTDLELWQRSGLEAPQIDAAGKQIIQGQKPTKKVKESFTIARKKESKQKIQLNAMKVFLEHTENVAYMRALAKDVKQLFEIANSPEYQERAGDLGSLLVLEHLDLIARKGGVAGQMRLRALDAIRRNVSAGVLGLKLSSAAIQWTALIDGASWIGADWAIKGVSNIAISSEWRNLIFNLPELKQRMGGEPAIQELVRGTWLGKIQAKGMLPLITIDRITAASIAAGAYEQKMKSMGLDVDFNNPNPEAVAYTQLVVRRTQASGEFKDIPLILSRGGSLAKSVFQFQNFPLFRWSRMRYDAVGVGVKTGDYGKMGGILSYLIFASLMASLTREAVMSGIDALTGRKKRKDDRLTRSMIFETAGTAPFVGQLMSMYLYKGEPVPMLQFPPDIVGGIRSGIEGKNEKTKLKGWIRMMTGLSALGGIPGSVQAQQIATGFLSRPEKKEFEFKDYTK